MASISTQMLLAINHDRTVAEAAVPPRMNALREISSIHRRAEGRQTCIASGRRKLNAVKTGSDPCVRILTGFCAIDSAAVCFSRQCETYRLGPARRMQVLK
jgi:hypothetical protein